MDPLNIVLGIIAIVAVAAYMANKAENHELKTNPSLDLIGEIRYGKVVQELTEHEWESPDRYEIIKAKYARLFCQSPLEKLDEGIAYWTTVQAQNLAQGKMDGDARYNIKRLEQQRDLLLNPSTQT